MQDYEIRTINSATMAQTSPIAVLLRICLATIMSAVLAFEASAQLQGRQTQGTIEPIPVALPVFTGADPKMAAAIADVISNDLERSGLFRPLNRASFLEQIGNVNQLPTFPNWRQVGADALVVGNVSNGSDGRLTSEFRVWDTVSGKQLAGQRFSTRPQNWRRIGHLIADQVYERLTGEKGYFDTRVVFVDETGPKKNRRKRLAIMDQDGANVRLLSQGSELVLTPRFSPTRQEIAYTQYTRDQPRVVLLDLVTNKRQVLGNFRGMTFAPRFSPDGPACCHELAVWWQFKPVRTRHCFQAHAAADQCAEH